MIYASLCWLPVGLDLPPLPRNWAYHRRLSVSAVALLEQTLNVVLLHRTTRRVTITEEGERIYEWAQRILQDVDQMMDELV